MEVAEAQSLYNPTKFSFISWKWPHRSAQRLVTMTTWELSALRENGEFLLNTASNFHTTRIKLQSFAKAMMASSSSVFWNTFTLHSWFV